MHQVVKIRTPSEAALALVQSRYPNYHPLSALADLAHEDSLRDDPRLRMEVHKAILPYVAPKLSSVEVSTVNPEDRRVLVSLFEDVKLEDGRTVPVEIPLVTEVEDLVPLDA